MQKQAGGVAMLTGGVNAGGQVVGTNSVHGVPSVVMCISMGC